MTPAHDAAAKCRLRDIVCIVRGAVYGQQRQTVLSRVIGLCAIFYLKKQEYLMETRNKHINVHRSDDYISLVNFWHLCVSHWNWFAVALLISFSYALYYIYVTPKIYTRKATILVRTEQYPVGTSVQDAEMFNDISLQQQVTSIEDVLQRIVSHEVTMEVVKRLHMVKDTADINAVLKAANVLQSRITARRVGEKSSTVDITYVDNSPVMAEKVLVALVRAYNDKWLEEKNMVARNTARFISDRLRRLEDDLGDVDDSLSAYKSRNHVIDVEKLSDVYIQKQTQAENEILQLNNQKTVAVYLQTILKAVRFENVSRDRDFRYELLPSNLGLNNATTEPLISRYNSIVFQLNEHLAYTTNKNPLVRNKEQELSTLRNTLISSIDNQINTINLQLNAIRGYGGDALSKISSNPAVVKNLVSIERQQKVKESLYLYLLRKQEENSISMSYSSYITKIINMPYGSSSPTFPVERNVYVLALLCALAVPMLILFLRDIFDNTIRSRSELEGLSKIPFIGEVPFYEDESQREGLRFWEQSRRQLGIVVNETGHDIVNESFRLIRSNIEFMAGNDEEAGNVYIVTSSYISSGKTFVSMNLSASLAIKNRVLFIDGDLRRSSASSIFGNPGVGLSDFLSGHETNIQNVIFQVSEIPGLYVLPVGSTPPNPTELLSSPRFKDLLGVLKQQFDYVIIDCPPTENLADTVIIEPLADHTIFVVRAGLFERKYLPLLEQMGSTGRFRHMSLVLNCARGDSYGKYGYDYNYYSYYGNGGKHRRPLANVKPLYRRMIYALMAVAVVVVLDMFFSLFKYLLSELKPDESGGRQKIERIVSDSSRVVNDSGRVQPLPLPLGRRDSGVAVKPSADIGKGKVKDKKTVAR